MEKLSVMMTARQLGCAEPMPFLKPVRAITDAHEPAHLRADLPTFPVQHSRA